LGDTAHSIWGVPPEPTRSLAEGVTVVSSPIPVPSQFHPSSIYPLPTPYLAPTYPRHLVGDSSTQRPSATLYTPTVKLEYPLDAETKGRDSDII